VKISFPKSIVLCLGLAMTACGSGVKVTSSTPLNAVATPNFTPAGGSYTSVQTVTIATTTSGATIRYTTDGSTPSQTNGTVYSSPVTVSTTTTLQAIAYESGYTNSSIATAAYTITGTVATPTFTPAGGTYSATQTVTLNTTTGGASIRYTTDGSTPSSTYGTVYTSAITVSATSTINAIAYESGWASSFVATAAYTITGTVATPTFSPAGGTYSTAQTVALSTTTGGATIRYTTDGSTPSQTNGTVYTSAITVSATTTINAIAYETGWTSSSVATATYTITGTVATPTFSPAGGTYSATQTVTLSTTTPGASIRYTTDGSTPSSTYGTVYTSPITVSATTTINAIAYETGWTSSNVASATYTINLPVAAIPTFTPAAGNYTTAQSVTISTTTSGATIRYTTDGSTPSPTSGTVYTNPITVSATTTINAIAYETGWTSSSVATATYTITSTGTVAAPTFSPAGGSYTTTQTVTLSTTTPGASINYTTDGSTPSPGTIYSGPFTVSTTSTVNAIASKSGMTSSPIATAVYTINTQNTVNAPYFSPAPSSFSTPPSVTIGTLTAGASIRYTTDGSTPTSTYGTLYTGPVTVSSTTTFNTIAYESGMTTSATTAATYTISVTGQVATPVLYPAAGQYTTAQTVSISDDASAYTINYTTDGSIPTATYGTLYTGPFTITSTTTVNAIAIENKKTPSAIATATYTINLEPTVGAPVFSPAGGSFSSPQTVTISSSTPGASIRYTETGLAPTPTTGTLYTGPIPVSVSTQIMAIAYETGYNPSSVVTSAYTITCASCPTVATPTFNPPAGPFYAATPVTITTSTPGATIIYTTDGSIPSATNGTTYTGPVTMQIPYNTDMTGMVTDASGLTMLKAVAINSGSTPSAVFTGIYTIIDPLRFPTTSSLIVGLAHMAYNVSAANWNSILSLWTNYLGFAVVEQTSTFALIKVNDQQFIELYQVASITAPEYQLVNSGFYVTDVEAFRQQMAAAGVSVPASSTLNALGNLSFFTTDPDGHQDEWLQYMPGSVTSQSLGQFMPSSELFGYIDDLGEASASVTNSATYFTQFGLDAIGDKIHLPNSNSYLEMLTYETLNQTQFGKHQKTQLVNFRGHDVLADAATLLARDPSIVQVISEEGGVLEGTSLMPTHNCVDVYTLDLSRIRVIDLNY